MSRLVTEFICQRTGAALYLATLFGQVIQCEEEIKKNKRGPTGGHLAFIVPRLTHIAL